MQERWWSGAPPYFNVPAVVERFVQDPSGAGFAALHEVGETYQYRGGNERLPLPPQYRAAPTLRQLAEIYHRPLVDLQGLNLKLADAVDDPLPPGTRVNIPDNGFAALLAARLAAAVLGDPALPRLDRTRLIRRLVPLAVMNPTALDTLLSRLLIAAQPSDTAILAELAGVAQLVANVTPNPPPRRES